MLINSDVCMDSERENIWLYKQISISIRFEGQMRIQVFFLINDQVTNYATN